MPNNNGNRNSRRPRTVPVAAPTPTPVGSTTSFFIDMTNISPPVTSRWRTGNYNLVSGYTDENDYLTGEPQMPTDLQTPVISEKMTKSETKEKEGPKETVSNEFIEKYIQSDEWVKRLHNKIEQYTYDGFVLNSAPEQRQAMLRKGPTELHLNTLISIAQTSKNFAGKNYEAEFLKQAITDFMAKNDFVALTEPENLATRLQGVLFNKYYTINAIVGYNSVDGGLDPILGSIPSSYVQVCPCCTQAQLMPDWMPNRRNCLQLTNAAHTRMYQGIVDNENLRLIPTENNQELYIRDHLSRYICEPCSRNTEKGWVQCGNCGRHDERTFSCDYPFGRNARPHCQKCFEDLLRSQMFINNDLEFQPQSLEINSRMRYVGCEFECYVKPNKVPNFSSKYVHQVKHDGSLSTAGKGIPVEVVTQPLLDWREEGIKNICKELSNINVSVDNTCGGHIHVDSTGLNMNRTNMLRMRDLFRIYETAFFAVCSSDRLNNSRYCAPVALDYQCGPQDNRYTSMNLCSLQSHNTIEFRCFDGSADSDEWLSRIALAEGFINFAKDSINNMIETSNGLVLKNLAKDAGMNDWDGILESYGPGRAPRMKELIAQNGAALINLAGCRFKLKPEIISTLVKQYEKCWKA